jgi:hypothetical protein
MSAAARVAVSSWSAVVSDTLGLGPHQFETFLCHDGKVPGSDLERSAKDGIVGALSPVLGDGCSPQPIEQLFVSRFQIRHAFRVH